ncbi:MAG: adenine-specific DNA methylase [Mycoplasmataceae bacterium CE_OT135]|nr:MAG: adenine-specific DNA methylase [Mycoplasmataceae bacterium CE_OT135]
MIYQTPENIQEFLNEIGRILQPNGFCLLWIAKKKVLNAPPVNLPRQLKVVDFLIWDKSPGLLLGSWFRNQAEFAYLVQKEPFSSKDFKDRSFGNVYQEKPKVILLRVHPHEKPVGLNKRLIEAVTEEGDLVVDPCAGGFGVLRICQATNREFLGSDLNYYQIREFMTRAKKGNHRTKKIN